MTTTNSTTRKPTKVQLFKEILETYELSEAHRELIQHEIEQLSKKRVSKKETETQKQNRKLGEAILDYLEACGEAKNIPELLKEIPELNGLSSQKVSPILSRLVKEGFLSRKEVGGRPTFSMVTEVEVEGE